MGKSASVNSKNPNKSSEVEVHELSKDPTEAWQDLSKKKSQKVITIDADLLKNDEREDHIRIVCMSDTHSMIHRIAFDIPDGDVFIHAGDFTKLGDIKCVKEFNDWLGRLPHKYKIVIAGNHELTFDPACKMYKNHYRDSAASTMSDNVTGNEPNVREYLTNCIYLEDESVELFGLQFYGTPWQPEFGNWAFNLTRGEQCLEKWNKIPEKTDVLITHGPPIGHGDLCRSGQRAGCVELLSTIQQRVQPKYHIFGHIHEGYGVTTNERTIFINASTCNLRYMPVNPPIVFDIKTEV
ncbi:Metallophosphoesterase domain-containing protein 1 [Pseudolycoriella hygida]|uniref:Metallophosphoesterase domain-containing protein 1 n=1 Tax=Pseudolycoriella hygida TaxID=35572 RepID=A0A9Q0MZA7_9DIPT|nr:Metallophosphoesterase domain-containing protein 1 [Pseudolycoriella hygida]